MGLRYVRSEPQGRGPGWLELRLTEAHEPPAYLATVRLFADRDPAPDLEHVMDVAAPVLERLGCSGVADYLDKASALARARALVLDATDGGRRPARLERDGLELELARERVTTTLDPREREVYRVAWRGEHALTFWVAEKPGAELCWVSLAFRKDPRTRPRAIEHGFSYVGWALSELAPVKAVLLRQPRPLALGHPLGTLEPAPEAERP